ncbi:MAG: hypothetical protein K0S26_941 [Bacteroidota bacterium]|jgi:hypothetical protein|nr:hypothetical protein [Bacteroidota bacterium]
MKEENKISKEPNHKVAVEVVPCAKEIKHDGTMKIMNHENQDDPCYGKITMAVMSEGSKLTKADAGRLASFTEEVFVSVRVLPVETGCTPVVEMSVSEKCFMTFQEVR